MTITIEELKDFIAEDVLGHHRSEYELDIDTCDNEGEDLTITNENHLQLFDLFVDSYKKYPLEEDGYRLSEKLDWLVWCKYEDCDDDELRRLMVDMFDAKLDIWTERLKLKDK